VRIAASTIRFASLTSLASLDFRTHNLSSSLHSSAISLYGGSFGERWSAPN
jgi:hypothetical protein